MDILKLFSDAWGYVPGWLPFSLKAVVFVWVSAFLYAVFALRTGEARKRIMVWLNSLSVAGHYAHTLRHLMARLRRAIRPRNLQGHKASLFEPMASSRRAARASAASPFSWRIMDFSLLIALVYPVFLAGLQWGFNGQAIALGDTELFPQENWGWQRAAVIGLIAIVVVPPVILIIGAAPAKRVVRQVLPVLNLVAVAVAFAVAAAGAFAAAGAGAFAVAAAGAFAVAAAGAFAAAGAVAGAFAGAVAFAVAFAGAFAVAFAVAVAGAFAVAVAGAFAVAVAWAVKHDKSKLAYAGLIIIGMSATFLSTGLQGPEVDRNNFQVFQLFLLLLPLINACFDFVSYGVTLALLQCGLKKGPGYAIFLGLADLGFAIVLYAALAATLTAAISLANIAGSPVFALGPLFQDIRAGNHPMWIYFMLFSTALPTTVHLVIVGFSLVNWVPQGLRDRLIWRINDWENSNHSKTIAALGVSTLWLTTTIAPFVALGFLTWGLFVVAPQIGETYLQIIELVARWFGEIKDIGPGYLPRTFEI